jgi:hypothetical protein
MSEQDDGLAQRQVDAFMRHLAERLDVDEAGFKDIVERQKKNGKVYVTISMALAIAIGLIGWLATRQIDALEAKVEKIETKQSDVRERLSAAEVKIDQLGRHK